MWTQVLTTVSVLLLAQVIFGAPKQEKDHKGITQFFEVDNVTYYLDAGHEYGHPEASYVCKNLNMDVIRFESREKWSGINRWLQNSEFSFYWFITDGVKTVRNATWVWLETGEAVANFYWGPNQPYYGEIWGNPMLIKFSYEGGGYHDTGLTAVDLAIMCQQK